MQVLKEQTLWVISLAMGSTVNSMKVVLHGILLFIIEQMFYVLSLQHVAGRSCQIYSQIPTT